MSSEPTVARSLARVTRAQLPSEIAGSRSTGWWAMVVLIANEAVLFASLVASYFYIRFNSPVWPLDGLKRPELLLPSIATVVLLSSSIFIHLGERGIQDGNVGRLRLFFGIALVLALIFLGIQGYEYARSEFGPRANVYGSLFFTITGLHGLHVIGAVFLNIIIHIWAGMGHFNVQRHQAVGNVALYWHFVDVVWIVVFSSLYLSVYL